MGAVNATPVMTLLAVGPSGASNIRKGAVLGSSVTVSGPDLSAIINVVVDAGVTNRPDGEVFCRRCGLCIAAKMYRGTNKMDSRYVFAIAKDKAFMVEQVFADGVAELERQIEKALNGNCPQRSMRNDV